MASAAKNKIIEEIKRDLFSDNDAVVLKAIRRCQEQGTSALVEPLIAFYASNADPAMKTEVAEMLNTLKVSGADAPFIEALQNPALKHIRRDLLSFMWNSGIQPVNDMAIVSQIAVEGDFEVAFESLTLLDSIESQIPEEVILESITIVQQFLRDAKTGDKSKLMREYLSGLERLRIETDQD